MRCAAAVEDCSKRFGAMAREALSSRTGIPVSALGGNTLSEMILGHLAQRVGEKIMDGEIPSGTPEQIEQAFRDEAGRFAAERASILEKVDALQLSDAAKANLKEWLLAQDKVSYLDLDAILDESRKYDFSPIVDALRPGLSAALERLSADPFALSVGPHFQEKEHQDYPLRASVATTLI